MKISKKLSMVIFIACYIAYTSIYMARLNLSMASDTLTDTLLKLNGVSDGKISYSRVVELLLQYYTGARAS